MRELERENCQWRPNLLFSLLPQANVLPLHFFAACRRPSRSFSFLCSLSQAIQFCPFPLLPAAGKSAPCGPPQAHWGERGVKRHWDTGDGDYGLRLKKEGMKKV